MTGLTQAQANCLAALKKLTVDGVPPSYEELQAELGLRNRSNVARLMVALRDRGLITFGHRARSVQVIEDINPAQLNAMGDAALRRAIALAAGILAHREGGYAPGTAAALRRIAARLEASPRTRAA
jgi:SOS-response transcriptional repressor LexA